MSHDKGTLILLSDQKAAALTRTRRVAAVATTLASLAVIGLVTLTPAQFSYRAHTIRFGFDLSPGHLREDALNALLFVPLGFGLAMARASALRVLTVAIAISAIVEVLQWTAVAGRFAEVQDIVANAAGAMLAWYVTHQIAEGKSR